MLKNHAIDKPEEIRLRTDQPKPSALDTEAFISGTRRLKDMLFDMSFLLRDLTEQQRATNISGYRNALLDAKISRTKLLYTGRWFVTKEELAAFVDAVNRGKRDMDGSFGTQNASLIPRILSLTAERSVAESFAAYGEMRPSVKQFGIVLTLDERKVEYYHIDTYVTPRGLKDNPNAVTLSWADEQEVRTTTALVLDCVIGAKVQHKGVPILSYDSLPSGQALMERLNGIVGRR
ncbi:MAG TPA: hypothetical protein VMV00_00475 [Candidatus Baltobacteraceae bacterium]|nr:hypothetical protein [Candidatus Baltobacteraceae bacterium]